MNLSARNLISAAVIGGMSLLLWGGTALSQESKASLSAPISADAGTEIDVSWTGPNGRGDFVVIAPAMAVARWYGEEGGWESTARGSRLKVLTPQKPGTYQLRYVDWESDTVLATKAIQIGASAYSPSIPNNVAPSAEFQLDWTGYSDQPGEFYIVPVSSYYDNRRSISQDRIGFTRDDDAFYFRAPSDPGAYRIHYQYDGDFLWSRNLFVGDTFYSGGYNPYDAWGYSGYRGGRDYERRGREGGDRDGERYGDREREFDFRRHPGVLPGLEVGTRGGPAGGGYRPRYYENDGGPLVIHPAGSLKVSGSSGFYQVMNDVGLVVAEGEIGGEPVGLLVGRYQVIEVDVPGSVQDVVIGTATESEIRF